MTKFVVNECHSMLIEMSFFMITKKFNFRINFDVINFSTYIIRKRILKRKTADISKKIKEIRKFVTENIKNVQEKQINNVDVYRKNIKYKIKDLMQISIKTIIINRLSKKLNYKIINSYFIIKVINLFYQIQFFESTKMFNIFYLNLLKKTFENLFLKQINEFASSMIRNDEKKWKIDDILDAKKHYRRIQFLIKWKEHDENKNWYNLKKFRNAIEIVKNFYEKYFDKSKFDWLKKQSN